VNVRPLLWCGVLLVLGSACGSKGDAPASTKGAPAGAPPTAVEVSAAFTDTVVDAIVATGQIEALQQIQLRPDVEGRVVEPLVAEGTVVAQGAPLVKIDDAELKAQVERARADRDLARQALERTRQLLGQKAAAQADLERAEAAARSSQASLDLLELRLARTVVRAPFAGVVGQRHISIGDYVTTSTPLLALQTVSPARATFSVPERYAAELKPGQRVEFQVAALPAERFEGRVDFVDPVITLPGRTLTVKALTANSSRKLKPGMFIEARLATETRPRAVVIPEEAISPTASASWVWVVVDGKATRREVELGVRMPGFVEIRKGIEPGDLVVIGGQDRIFEGAAVKPTEIARRPQAVGKG
jgi:membrane fusion protein (multidrug efflux system)